MVVEKLSMEAIKIDPNEVYVGSIYSNEGGSIMKANSGNGFIDSKDLELAEQRLTNKIDVSETKLSGKIDTVEAKISGRMDVLNTKLSSLDDKIATQTKRMDWLIALVIGSILVPVFIKLFFK